MSKKELKELNEKYELVLKENENLKMQIENLNENTIVSSMNDMKYQYEELENL